MTDLGVKANLDPTTWAGAFDCSACGRKRLPAVEFSKNMVLKRQKDESAKIRCKTCTAADEVKEREAAAAKAAIEREMDPPKLKPRKLYDAAEQAGEIAKMLREMHDEMEEQQSRITVLVDDNRWLRKRVLELEATLSQ